MAAMTEIQKTLQALEPGTHVRLRLTDGSEVSGVIAGEETRTVRRADSDEEMDVVDVERVLLRRWSEGPE